jgi:hypothetical protein
MSNQMHGHSMINKEMQDCIQACQDCYSVCLETTQHCLQMGGKHAEAAHIGLMLDCGEICKTSEAFMLRMSDLHPKVCGVCADACEACAQSCEQFGDDQTMKRCAEACRHCAETCRTMEASKRTTQTDKNAIK